ncbi:CASP-like protein 2C3 isoform X1 [Miscanthus floridulus]|uniref:CASP-like protein 2C3 isoform X1 n=1 Tax=Miscanthus floridulus TaxID=154761 RepID=UPI003459243D
MVAAARVWEVKAEGLLRGACAALAAAAALLVGLSTQTETVLLVTKKATVKDVQALWVLAMAAAAAAVYHLLQLLKCFYLGRVGGASPCRRSSRALAWTCLLLDKVRRNNSLRLRALACAYTTFATTVEAAQACVIALDGAHALQWTKLCNIYTRFCEQIAGSLVLGMLAAVGTAVLSAASARNVFRHYSPSSSPPPGTYAAAH